MKKGIVLLLVCMFVAGLTQAQTTPIASPSSKQTKGRQKIEDRKDLSPFLVQPDGSKRYFSEYQLKNYNLYWNPRFNMNEYYFFFWVAQVINEQLTAQHFHFIGGKLVRDGTSYNRGYVTSQEAKALWANGFLEDASGDVTVYGITPLGQGALKPRQVRSGEQVYKGDISYLRGFERIPRGKIYVDLAFSSCGNPGYRPTEYVDCLDQNNTTWTNKYSVGDWCLTEFWQRINCVETMSRIDSIYTRDTTTVAATTKNTGSRKNWNFNCHMRGAGWKIPLIAGVLFVGVQELRDGNWIGCMFKKRTTTIVQVVTPPPPPPPKDPVVIDNGTVWNVPTSGANQASKQAKPDEPSSSVNTFVAQIQPKGDLQYWQTTAKLDLQKNPKKVSLNLPKPRVYIGLTLTVPLGGAGIGLMPFATIR